MKIFTKEELTNNKIWICSDWHFYHDKDFVYAKRGVNNVIDMNHKIIENHNSIVAPEDIVICLGDAVMNDCSAGINCIQQLNGRKYLAIGNHDTDNKIEMYKEANCFEAIEFGYRFVYKHYAVWLTHHPMPLTNEGDKKMRINIHGHTHSDEPNSGFMMYNACLDAHDCFPILLDDIIVRTKVYANERSEIALETSGITDPQN